MPKSVDAMAPPGTTSMNKQDYFISNNLVSSNSSICKKSLFLKISVKLYIFFKLHNWGHSNLKIIKDNLHDWQKSFEILNNWWLRGNDIGTGSVTNWAALRWLSQKWITLCWHVRIWNKTHIINQVLLYPIDIFLAKFWHLHLKKLKKEAKDGKISK